MTFLYCFIGDIITLGSHIVKTCWNRCFPSANNSSREESQVIDPRAKDPCLIFPGEVVFRIFSYLNLHPRAKDPCLIFPGEVVFRIFSYLNLHELGVSRCVNKRWRNLASDPILWREVIYREIAFSSKNWAEWNTDLVKNVDMRQEMLSLPNNIAEELKRSAFPGKNIRETHVLVRMPKGLTIKKLKEFAKKYFPNNIDGFRLIPKSVDELGDTVDKSVWLLMTKDVFPGSRSKSYSQQKNIVDQLAKATEAPYQIPTTLEAATCILAEYSRSKNRLFSDSYIRCQENVPGQMVVGFAFAGLDVIESYYFYDNDNIGVAALRRF